MSTPAERRAAQRRLAREINTGTYQKSSIGTRAREAAAIGSASQADIRADLEERAYRRAVAGLEHKARFNGAAVEARIQGGIAVTYKGSGTEYYPQATLANGIVTQADGSMTFIGRGKVSVLPGMTNDQLRKAISMSGTDWEKLAKRSFKYGQSNRWLYH
jgi:hypothetical protein